MKNKIIKKKSTSIWCVCVFEYGKRMWKLDKTLCTKSQNVQYDKGGIVVLFLFLSYFFVRLFVIVVFIFIRKVFLYMCNALLHVSFTPPSTICVSHFFPYHTVLTIAVGGADIHRLIRSSASHIFTQ